MSLDQCIYTCVSFLLLFKVRSNLHGVKHTDLTYTNEFDKCLSRYRTCPSSFVPLPSQPWLYIAPSTPLRQLFLFLSRKTTSVCSLQGNRIIQYILFCAWLLLLCLMLMKSIRVSTGIRSLALMRAVVINNHAFIYSPIKGHLHYKATMNILAHPLFWTGFHLLWVNI